MLGYTPPEQTPPPQEQTPWEQTPPRSRHPPGADPPPPSVLGDMVNVRVVRILLECNLVTPVCHSVHREGGVCPSACWDTPPAQCMLGDTGNKHPTGMHTCLKPVSTQNFGNSHHVR